MIDAAISWLMTLELMSGIPTEAMVSAPLAMGAGMHVIKAAEQRPKPVAEGGAWKGMEARRALSPKFVDMACVGLTIGLVIGVAAFTGWIPGLDGLQALAA